MLKRFTIEIDEQLLRQVMEVFGVRTKRAAVDRALRELITDSERNKTQGRVKSAKRVHD